MERTHKLAARRAVVAAVRLAAALAAVAAVPLLVVPAAGPAASGLLRLLLPGLAIGVRLVLRTQTRASLGSQAGQ